MSDKYNGWTNYETWSANLWLDQEYWSDQAKESDSIGALAERIQKDTQYTMDETIDVDHGMFADLIQSAFDRINWFEIVEHIFEDVNEEV